MIVAWSDGRPRGSLDEGRLALPQSTFGPDRHPPSRSLSCHAGMRQGGALSSGVGIRAADRPPGIGSIGWTCQALCYRHPTGRCRRPPVGRSIGHSGWCHMIDAS